MSKDHFSMCFIGSLLLIFYFYYGISQDLFLYLGIGLIILAIVAEVLPYLSKIKRFSNAQLQEIDQMSGDEFEQYVAFLLERQGYEKVKKTQACGDQGIDVIATKDQVKYGFQCKRWKKKVGNKAVQEVHAGIGYYQLDKAIVITNSSFTKSAQELAEKLNVALWDRNHLKKMIMEMKKAESKPSKA